MIAGGGFKLKGITVSGKPPPPHLSEDGVTINVAGMKWWSEGDFIQHDISELNFARKSRGKKPPNQGNSIPEKLTKEHCASKVAEIFDLVGLLTPITAGMKVDLREIPAINRVQWKECIPDN